MTPCRRTVHVEINWAAVKLYGAIIENLVKVVLLLSGGKNFITWDYLLKFNWAWIDNKPRYM